MQCVGVDLSPLPPLISLAWGDVSTMAYKPRFCLNRAGCWLLAQPAFFSLGLTFCYALGELYHL